MATPFLTIALLLSLSFTAVHGQENETPAEKLFRSMSAEEKAARLERTSQQLIDALLGHYGKKFGGSYVEGLSVMVRLGERGVGEAMPVIRPGLFQPAKLRGGSQVAGRLLFAELAPTMPEAKELTLAAAELGFDDREQPLSAFPYHNEMSDAIFMAGPLLAKAGALTGERRFFDQAIRQVRFIQDLCLREDGLYRHSPLDESAWGRGNGFPALGLSMILEELPADHPDREFAELSFGDHLAALKPYQDEDGMWHQVIDHPESYPEFTCTCMISTAVLKGIRLRIIDASEWDEALDKSWRAIRMRVSLDGRDVNGACTGTGKQKNLEAYLKRKEIHGFDSRGGSMALLFASELKRSAR